MCAPMSCARCMVCCGRKGLLLGEEAPGKIIAECRADGTDVSLSITAEEKAFGTELTISLRRPCDGIPEQRAYRLLQRCWTRSSGIGKYPDDERGGRNA